MLIKGHGRLFRMQTSLAILSYLTACVSRFAKRSEAMSAARHWWAAPHKHSAEASRIEHIGFT
jgi:hypothetical protein